MSSLYACFISSLFMLILGVEGTYRPYGYQQQQMHADRPYARAYRQNFLHNMQAQQGAVNARGMMNFIQLIISL